MSLHSNKFMLASLLSLPLHKYNDRVREWSWILDTSLTMNDHWRSNYYWTKVIYSVAYLVSELPLRPKDTYSFTYTIKSIYLVSTTHGNYCTIQNRDNTHTQFVKYYHEEKMKVTLKTGQKAWYALLSSWKWPSCPLHQQSHCLSGSAVQAALGKSLPLE